MASSSIPQLSDTSTAAESPSRNRNDYSNAAAVVDNSLMANQWQRRNKSEAALVDRHQMQPGDHESPLESTAPVASPNSGSSSDGLTTISKISTSIEHQPLSDDQEDSSSDDDDEDEEYLIGASGIANPRHETTFASSPTSNGTIFSTPLRNSSNSGSSSPLNASVAGLSFSHSQPLASGSRPHFDNTSNHSNGTSTTSPGIEGSLSSISEFFSPHRVFSPIKISAPPASSSSTPNGHRSSPTHSSSSAIRQSSNNNGSSSATSSSKDSNWTWVQDIDSRQILYIHHLPTVDFQSCRYYRRVLENLLSLVNGREATATTAVMAANPFLTAPVVSDNPMDQLLKIKFLHLLHRQKLTSVAPHIRVQSTHHPALLILNPLVNVEIALGILDSYLRKLYSPNDDSVPEPLRHADNYMWVCRASEMHLTTADIKYLIRPTQFPHPFLSSSTGAVSVNGASIAGETTLDAHSSQNVIDENSAEDSTSTRRSRSGSASSLETSQSKTKPSNNRRKSQQSNESDKSEVIAATLDSTVDWPAL
eukprot:Partr_v1_DN27939_c0_g1_i1_m11339